jgi:RNA polymerase sigma-70 factor (ECF subfamily)
LPDETELVRQIGRGDAAAFRTLVDREARYLYGVAHGLTGNPADAEDLVQETFAAVLSGRFRGESSLRTWLVSILVKKAGMLRRSRSRRDRHESLSAMNPAGRLRLAGAPAAEQAQARLDLTTMLAALSPDHRAVIVLRELQGMTYDEMASVLQVPQGTVESRLHRAREELRKRFADYM